MKRASFYAVSSGIVSLAELHIPSVIKAFADKNLAELKALGSCSFTGKGSHLLSERADIMGLPSPSKIGAGGSCHLVACLDGRIALNLAREDDWELMPAWLEVERKIDNWDELSEIVNTRSAKELTIRGRELGLAIGLDQQAMPTSEYYRLHHFGQSQTPKTPPLIVDLSSLWAGPLVGRLLGHMGARVVKVESTSRPDGARHGNEEFFETLNGLKEQQSFDLQSAKAMADFKSLIENADIVIEASRPRALRQMDIVAEHMISKRPGKVWLSITAYGRAEPEGNWIGFGDDIGVDAGLSFGKDHFCGDAIADPLTGISGALAVWQTWVNGGGCLIDLSMRDVVRSALC